MWPSARHQRWYGNPDINTFTDGAELERAYIIMDKLQKKATGTRLLDTKQERLVFFEFPLIKARGQLPTHDQVKELLSIARRLGIV